MKRFCRLFLLAGILFILPVYLYAQVCTNQSRVYAGFQDSQEAPGGFGSSVSISNNARAADTDPATASTLSINSLLGLSSITQYLEFSTDGSHAGKRSIPSGTPFTIKVSIPAAALSVAGTIEVGAFTGLSTGTKNATRTALYSGSTTGLISGAGAVEITLTPTQAYEGVYVKLSANLTLGLKADIYGAYILEDNPLDIECDKGIDVLTGVNGAGLLNATASVSNPYAAIDADPAYTTFATLNTGLQAANEVYLTALFAKGGQPLDSVKIVYDGGGGLSLFSGFNIQPYLGAAVAGGVFNNANVTVKPIAGTTKFEVSFPVAEAFDRIKISWGGLLAIGTELHIYNVTKVIPKPDPLIDGQPLTFKNVCFGNSTTLSINNLQQCTTYKWYADKTSITPLYTGSTYSLGTLPVGDHIYYVESRRNNCISSISERVKVTIRVNPLPDISVSNVTSCSGSTVNLSVNNPIAGISYNWYDAATNGNLLHAGTGYTTPVLTANTTYYVEAVDQITGCPSSSRGTLSVNVKPLATVSATTGTAKICIGDVATLSNATVGGTWSSINPLIATVNATTGEITGITAGSTIIRYSIPDGPANCANAADFNLTVVSPPGITLGADPEICSGFTSSSLTYTNAINTPITYSISWVTSGFTALTDQPLPAGNIPFAIPANTGPGTYSGVLTVKNANGCSTQYNFSVKINPKPPAPHVLVPITSQY